jgi:hypothetical protein
MKAIFVRLQPFCIRGLFFWDQGVPLALQKLLELSKIVDMRILLASFVPFLSVIVAKWRVLTLRIWPHAMHTKILTQEIFLIPSSTLFSGRKLLFWGHSIPLVL